jgi:hypothetical protein
VRTTIWEKVGFSNRTRSQGNSHFSSEWEDSIKITNSCNSTPMDVHSSVAVRVHYLLHVRIYIFKHVMIILIEIIITIGESFLKVCGWLEDGGTIHAL